MFYVMCHSYFTPQLVWETCCVCGCRGLLLPIVCVCPRFCCATTCSEVYQSSPRATELITSSRTQRWRLSPCSRLHSVLPSVLAPYFSSFNHYGSTGVFPTPLLFWAHTAKTSSASRCTADQCFFVRWLYFRYFLTSVHVETKLCLRDQSLLVFL